MERGSKASSRLKLALIAILFLAVGLVIHLSFHHNHTVHAGSTYTQLSNINLSGQTFYEEACIASSSNGDDIVSSVVYVNKQDGPSVSPTYNTTALSRSGSSTTSHDNWISGSTSSISFDITASPSSSFELGLENGTNSATAVYGQTYVISSVAKCSSGVTEAAMSSSSALPICDPITATASLVSPNCRALIGAAARENPGTPSDPLTSNQIGDSEFQFDYFQQTLLQNNLNVYRAYDICSQSKTSPITTSCNANIPFTTGTTPEIFAAHKDTYNKNITVDFNWKPAANWVDADGSTNGVTSPTQAAVNAEITQAAKNMMALAPHEIFLTVWWEPESAVSSYTQNANCSIAPPGGSGGAGTPEQYKAMWQNVENIFNSVYSRAGVANNIVWTMDDFAYLPHICLGPLLYPGNSLIDWVIFDTYDRDTSSKTDTFATTAGTYYNYLKSEPDGVDYLLKPWGIGEMGTCQNPSLSNSEEYYSGTSTSDISNTSALYGYTHNEYPNLKLYIVFATTNGGAAGPGCLTDYDSGGLAKSDYQPAKQAAFNNFFDGILGNNVTPPPPTPTVTITAPTANQVLTGNATVSATASVSSGSISKITLSEVNSAGTSTQLAQCSSSPCDASWNTNNVANGNYTINASATASGGGSANAKAVPVSVANTSPCTPPIISTPSGLSSPTGDQTTNSITLTWGASTDCKKLAITYHVFRAENGNWKQVGSPTATTYTDSGLTAGTTYDYEVDATDTAGNTSDMSSTLTQETVVPDCSPPGIPANLSGTATSDTTISLSWGAITVPGGDNNCQLLYYVVARTDPSGNITTFTPTSNSFNDTGLTPNTSYSYTVLAEVTGHIKGDSTNPKMVTTDNAPCTDPGPTAPGSLSFPIVTTTGVTLTWNESTDVCGISGYNVFREQQGGSSFTQVNAKLVPQPGSGTTVSFGDNSLTPATTYNYYVVAVSGESKTAQSNTVPVTTLANPVNPTGGGTGSNGSNSPLNNNPLLIGTTSVGSGSEAGGSVSQNPTSTSLGLSSLPSKPSKAKLTTKKLSSSPVAAVLYSLAGVALLAGCMVLIVFRRHHRYRPAATTPYDPDIFQPQIVHPDSAPTVHPGNDPNQTNENNKEN